MNEFTITKDSVECYKLRSVKGYYADITLDCRGGRVSVVCDHGAWTNTWGATGIGFKEFLCGLDIGYAANKFNVEQEFDFDDTIRTYSQAAEKMIGVDNYDHLSYEIGHLANTVDTLPKAFFVESVRNSPNIMRLYDGMPPICYRMNSGFKRFWEEMWPVFVAELKRELTAEPSAVDGTPESESMAFAEFTYKDGWFFDQEVNKWESHADIEGYGTMTTAELFKYFKENQ